MSKHVTTDPYLEREYNVRTLRDDMEQVIAGWGVRSSEFRYRVDCDLDLVYGPGDRDRLDLFRGDKNGPVLIYIHGGYWQRGDKSIYSFVAEPFVAQGINVALLNYDLCPNGSVPTITQQIQNAIIWLWRSAKRLGIPDDRINVSGHSAGGHLTGMMMATNWSSLHAELPVDLVKTGVPISGLYDLAPLQETTINDAVGLDNKSVRKYSPLFFEPATEAPILVCIGGAETKEFHGQTERFVNQWNHYAAPVEHFVVPGVDHFDVVNRLADTNADFSQAVVSWLR